MRDLLQHHTQGHLKQPEAFSYFCNTAKIATESGSISSANHRHLWRSPPLFASSYREHRRFAPFQALEGLDSGFLKINKPPQSVVDQHHHDRKLHPRLADGAKKIVTHLSDGREQVLDPGARIDDAFIAPLLAVGRWRVALAFTQYLVPKAVFLQHGFTLRGRIALGYDLCSSN